MNRYAHRFLRSSAFLSHSRAVSMAFSLVVVADSMTDSSRPHSRLQSSRELASVLSAICQNEDCALL